MIGNENRITNNTVTRSSDDSVRIEGDGNVLLSNLTDGNVRLRGNGNTVVNSIFTKPRARLILEGSAAHTTTVIGVPEDRILRV